ncbi:ATP-binding cassette domain-containing protein [Methanoregula sp.]|uniref:ATP-binding cassette domain-containing protein n=1 Tax=Methanoregula sp. TaxID=2052170 RepID=UPI00341C2F03
MDYLSLSVNNEIFGLLGPNGSGKTTNVQMLTTLLRPTEGTASVCGHDIVRAGEQVRKAAQLCAAGYGSRHQVDRAGERPLLCPPLRHPPCKGQDR